MTAVLLLLIINLLVPQTLHVIPRAHGASKTVSLIGSYQGWNYTQPSGANPPITVNPGDVVMISLSSADGMTHQFALDIDKDGPMVTGTCTSGDQCSTNFGPSTPTSISITVNFRPGTYKYFCTYHSLMVGNFIVQPPDFGLSANPTSLSFLQGSSATSTITVTGQNRFNGTISLSASVSPSGPSTTLKPPSVTISSTNPQQTSTLSINSTISNPTGTYTITVTGTNGTLGPSHMTSISVTVNSPNFSLTANPTSIGVIRGSAGNMTTITLKSLNGFAGTVSLTATPSDSGLADYFNPASVTLASGGSGTSTISVSTSSTAPGFYSIMVNGTSGSTTNATTLSITVTIPDFRMNPSPFSLSLAQGSSATTTITITSLSGFKGTLTITGTISPSGPSVSFNPASVALFSGGSVTSVMTLSTNGSVGTGTYTVTVTVTNGTLTHSTTVPVTIGSSGSPLILALLIGAGVGAAAIIGVAVFLLRRRGATRV